MTNPLRRTFAASLTVAAGVLWGQAAGPAFEVATIHPPPPETIAQQIEQGKLRVGMSIGPARVDIRFLSLADLIAIAYRVRPFEVSGPEWMKTSRWDILAKMPDGSSKDQVPEMLRALLTERFKLQVRKESKEQNVYALVAASPKLKPAEPSTGDVPGDQVQQSADGKTMTVSGGSLGPVRVTMPDAQTGSMRVELNVSMARLAELLSSLVDKPVVDMTGLQGSYQVPLELSSVEAKAVMRAGIGFGGIPELNEPAESVFEAVKKLGLKLEARKAPLGIIVVDRLEKTPTAN
ncbi:conserved exported hypothetical protein [Candidatus Sulfopaludibacter sp. SbA3]|nr:conserved exported hypothetical protein [Candidatus Sulfopaludibacter sp. SbA3]